MARGEEGRAPHLTSKEERDRWQIGQYGEVRNGFRTLEEPTDDRPLLIYAYPFWKDGDEEGRYIKAVRLCPASKYGHLDVYEYLREVAVLANGMEPLAYPVKAMHEIR